MITELESLQQDAKDEEIKRLNLELAKEKLEKAQLRLEMDKLKFELNRKPRREFVPVPFGI